jgi:hypothetical protein
MKRISAILTIATAAALLSAAPAFASAESGSPAPQSTAGVMISRHPSKAHCEVSGAAGFVKGWWTHYKCVQENYMIDPRVLYAD